MPTNDIEKLDSEGFQELPGLEKDDGARIFSSKITKNNSHFLARIPKFVRENLNIKAGDFLVFEIDLSKDEPTLEKSLKIYISQGETPSHQMPPSLTDEVID